MIIWPTDPRRWLSSLRVQILLWTIFPVVLVLIAISFTSIYTHQQSMRSLVAQRDGELARIAAARLSDSLISRGGAVTDLATLAQRGLVALPSEEQPGRRRTIYLVDQAGRVVYHPDPTLVGRELGQHLGITEVRQGKSGATFHYEANGEEVVIGYAPVTPTGWGLIVQEPWADVIAPVMQYSLIAPLTLLVATLLSLLAIYFVVRRIIRPLQLLSLQAHHMAWGDFTATQNPVGGVREIEDLRRSLNQMGEQIRRYQSGMHSYIVAITQAQEEERKRIARELHDETIQSLVALAHRVGLAQKVLARDPSQMAVWLAELRSMANTTADSARRFTRDLRPPYLEDLGLVPAVEALANGANRDSLMATFRVIGVPRRLGATQELCLYRIAQEALSNVVRHAQASQIQFQLVFSPDGVTLSIEDNGHGFPVPDMPDELAQQGHFGIMGMRERALLLGGHLSVRSAPGRGTKGVLNFPR